MMQIFTVVLLIGLTICQWGYAKTIPPPPDAESCPASAEVEEDFVAKPIEEIEELFRQKQYQIVIEECERLIAYDPWRWESNWARLKLSECYTALGQPEKAQAILAEAEMSHPEGQAEVLMWQLHAAIEKEQLDNADKLVDAIETKFIGEHFVLEAMAEIITSHLEHDRLEDARRRINLMLQKYPFQEQTLWLSLRLGEHYREHEEHQGAIELFQRIRKHHPDRVETAVQLAGAYREVGEIDRAIEACNAAIETYPAHWSIVHVWSMLGDMYQEKGDLQAAVKAFLTASEFRGTDQARWALRRVAQLYQQSGESEQAVELLTKLSVEGWPDRFDTEVLINLAAVYVDSSDYECAESTLKELIESYPQTQHAQEAMLRLLEMYWETNQREKAVDFFRSLLAHPNPHLRVQIVRRFIEESHEEGILPELEARGKLPELARILRQAVDRAISPAVALGPLRGLAVITEWQDDWDEAIKVNTRLIEGYDDLLIELQAREHLAESYSAKGEFGKALDQVSQIYAIAPGGQKALSAKLHLAHYQLEHERNHSSALKLLRELAEESPNSEEGHEAIEILERFERHGKEMDHGR
jgi:tetratricopeptide (TPR) repeat protein